MTYTQCLAEIGQLRHRWRWTVSGIRSLGVCPLVALQHAKGVKTPHWLASQAATNLGLRPATAQRIILMSDGRRPATPQFLRALGLTP